MFSRKSKCVNDFYFTALKEQKIPIIQQLNIKNLQPSVNTRNLQPALTVKNLQPPVNASQTYTHHLINKIIDKFLKMMKTIIVMSKQNLLLKLFCISLSCIFIANYSSSYTPSPEAFFFYALNYDDKEDLARMAKGGWDYKEIVHQETPEIFKSIYSVEILKILINDFDLNIHATSQSNPDKSSIYYARDPMVAKYLFDNGVTDKKATGEQGKNSLYYAVISRDDYDVAEMLFVKGVSPYIKLGDGLSSAEIVNNTFLKSDFLPSRKKSDLRELINLFNVGNNDFIKTFVLSKYLLFDAINTDNHKNVKAVMQNYQLHINDYAPKIFRYIKSVAMLEFLIDEFGLDMSIEQKKFGLNALHYVKFSEVAEYIIDNTNLEVDAMTSRKETPLYYATKDRKDDVIELLFEKGACPYIRGPDGYSPVDIVHCPYRLFPSLSTRCSKRLHKLFQTSECKPIFSKFFDYFK